MKFLVFIQPDQSDAIANELFNDLSNIEAFPVEPPKPIEQSITPTRGEPLTVLAVIAIAVGAGGALTAALSKDGFFNQLARVLEKYTDRQIHIEAEDKDGNKFKISGSAAEIRQLMRDLLEEETTES